MCACVRVCKRQREREGGSKEGEGQWAKVCEYVCVCVHGFKGTGGGVKPTILFFWGGVK